MQPEQKEEIEKRQQSETRKTKPRKTEEEIQKEGKGIKCVFVREIERERREIRRRKEIE